MTRTIIERLPRLRMIASTGTRNASIDLKAAEERGVQVVHTGHVGATIETDWGTYPGQCPQSRRRERLAAQRRMCSSRSVMTWPGRDARCLGLGNVGGAVAQIGKAFGMKVIAWSQNLDGRARQRKRAPSWSPRRNCSGGGYRLRPPRPQQSDARASSAPPSSRS